MSTSTHNPSDLSTLTPDDGRLLHNLFAFNFNLFRLAEHEQRPLHELLAWSSLPHIVAAIERLTQLQESAHKAAALAHLRHIADTTDDAIERRRAATTLLRALAHPSARSSTPPQRRASPAPTGSADSG